MIWKIHALRSPVAMTSTNSCPRRKSRQLVLELLEQRTLLDVVTFFDGTFNDSDWTMTPFVLGHPTPGEGSVTTSQQLSGGNPGSYRQITHTVLSGYPEIYEYDMRSEAIYNPHTQGPIAAIDYSEDAIAFSGGGQGAGPAIEQDGRFYFGSYYVTSDTRWEAYECSSSPTANHLPLKESDFSLDDLFCPSRNWKLPSRELAAILSRRNVHDPDTPPL